jgi:acetolactate synthase small subunit
MLRRMIRRLFYGKRNHKDYSRLYVTWNYHNQDIDRLNAQMNNLLSKLKLQKIGNGNLIGDKKDAKVFDKQWS